MSVKTFWTCSLRINCQRYCYLKPTSTSAAYTSDVRVRCEKPGCKCYPFICFRCKKCQEKWWTHCKRGTPPRGVCSFCYKSERRLTDWALRRFGNKFPDWTPEQWYYFAFGINPEYYCYHPQEQIPFVIEIVAVQCRLEVAAIRCNECMVKAKSWPAYTTRLTSCIRHIPTRDSCCREDGNPRVWPQPSRRARQRRKTHRRKEPATWDVQAALAELPQDW